MWKARARPTALTTAAVGLDEAFGLSTAFNNAEAKSGRRVHGLIDAQAVWTLSECAKVFISATVRLLERNLPQEFDKDDDDAMDFVTAVSNLRSANYGIPLQSLFDAKGMAGNIIHAVATTNAIVSGLIVLEAIKILHKRMKDIRYTFVLQHPSNGRLLQPIAVEEPNPKCVVCGNARVLLECDTNKMTKYDLVSKVLKKKLSVNLPTVQAGEVILHEEGDDLEEDEVEEYEAFNKRVLSALPGGGINHGTILVVEDFSQDMKFELMILHREEWDEENEPDGFLVSGEDVKANVMTAEVDGAAAETTADDNNNEELMIIDTDIIVDENLDTKRKRGVEDSDDQVNKVQKT
jgi:ubiquitin-like 1-activating enzyme E1 B